MPRPHVVYVVHVELPGKAWDVYRRYSEFSALHAKLAPPAPPAPLPPKHIAAQSLRMLTGLGGIIPPSEAQRRADVKALDERREALELYLRAIISARDDRWRNDPVFLAFLQLSTDARTSPKSHDAPPAAHTVATFHRPIPDPAKLRSWSTQKPAEETDTTRTLSDTELLQHQTHTQMQMQDAQAEQLARILQRQRQIGLAIHDEVSEQNQLLSQLGTDVQASRSRMDATNARMKQL